MARQRGETINRFLEGRRGLVYCEYHQREGRDTLGAVLVELRGLPRLRLQRYKMTTHNNVPALKYESVGLPEQDKVFFGISAPLDDEAAAAQRFLKCCVRPAYAPSLRTAWSTSRKSTATYPPTGHRFR